MLSTEQLIPALAFVTFGIAIVYAIVHFFSTTRKREGQDSPLTRASEHRRAREGSIIEK